MVVAFRTEHLVSPCLDGGAEANPRPKPDGQRNPGGKWKVDPGRADNPLAEGQPGDQAQGGRNGESSLLD